MANVLVVDDSAFIRKLLRDIIEKSGISEIDEASDGIEAVQAARAKPYSLIFMDIMMPRMEGLEATKDILTYSPNTKVIICTSVQQADINTKSAEVGAKDIILKPFDEKSVHAVLQKHLGVA